MIKGEVWWVAFDPSLGGEIKKTRPAVIVSNNAANSALNLVVVVPLTSQTARVYPGEALVTVGGQPAKAMADQIMAASKLRLRSRMDVLSPQDLRSVEDAILLHLGIKR
ncbi:MAG: type II toxin-antitoxin system PemK/MazF family toxin [Candidatus Sericytochromatia bacterium]|nr:type II toxin-antitoxin system PemK/MazF family toxin [Candidatus Tanganyikabacteria bacterium]